MAGTSRFHDKMHRANHHSVTTPGLPDSAYDPIASKDYPFRGDFVLSGALSALNDATVNSLTTRKNLTVNEIAQFDGPIYTNNTGSVVTTNSYPVTSNNGPATLTFNYNKGVYINGTYGSTPKLTIGAPGIDAGIFSVTNVAATSARLTSLTVSSAVGIGTAFPQHQLHVVGDVVIYGSLTANGNSYFQNTLFTTTSSLSIINTGTGAGLTVSQEGNQPIVAFYDHESTISLWADGDASRPGWVGVKTRTPNVEFTVLGNISASSKIYSGNSNSDQWYSGYSTVLASSASWGGGGSASTVVTDNSAKWDSSYSTVLASSASWSSGGTASSVVATNSAKWESNYSTTSTNSAKWESNYSTTSTNSAKWESNYTSTSTNSARWVANYTSTSTNSAKWDSSYSTVLASSASWSAGGGSGGAVYSTVNSLSTNWNNSYTTLTANSALWVANYTTTNTKSASWDSSYSTLLASSASWNAGGGSGGSVYSTVNSLSTNWNDSYTTLTANSAAWSAKANAVHTHAIADVTGLQTALDGKASTSHTHTIADVTNLQTTLDGKASSTDARITLVGTTSANWNNSYTTTSTNSAAWSAKANAVHTHAIADVTGLQTALDGKAAVTNGPYYAKTYTTSTGGAVFTVTASTSPTVSNANYIVSLDGVMQVSDIDYSVSGTTMTFTNAVDSGVKVHVLSLMK